MKKFFLSAMLFSLFGIAAHAQRFAYVDTEYILGSMPDYNDAQAQLDSISKDWQGQIDKQYADIDALYKKFQNEQVLLTDEMKQQRMKEIQDKEKAVKDFQKQKFGYQGDLFQKRQELVKPIQDKVYDAIQKYATLKAYDVIFDKSGSTTLLYTSDKLDVSDAVITAMGYTPKKQ